MKTELLVGGYEVKLTIVWLCGERAYSWTTRYRPGSRPASPCPHHTPQCTSHRSWGTYSHQNMYGFHPGKMGCFFFNTVYTFLIKKNPNSLLKKKNILFSEITFYRCRLYMYLFAHSTVYMYKQIKHMPEKSLVQLNVLNIWK